MYVHAVLQRWSRWVTRHKERMGSHSPNTKVSLRNLVVFGGVAAAFLIVDQLSKLFASTHELGERFSESFLGLFHFQLVHNTGGAWSIFDDSTMMLAWISVAICVVLLVMFANRFKRCSLLETFGYAMVVSGGIGNAIDRFILGYVRDFFYLDFVSFPVFNVADIGVTCGFVILFIGIMFFDKSDQKGGL